MGDLNRLAKQWNAATTLAERRATLKGLRDPATPAEAETVLALGEQYTGRGTWLLPAAVAAGAVIGVLLLSPWVEPLSLVGPFLGAVSGGLITLPMRRQQGRRMIAAAKRVLEESATQ